MPGIRPNTDDDYVEPLSLARRRELPDMIRDVVATGNSYVQLILDAKTALNLANDLEFAVKYRGLNEDQ